MTRTYVHGRSGCLRFRKHSQQPSQLLSHNSLFDMSLTYKLHITSPQHNFFIMSCTDQPGKSAPSPVPAPDKDHPPADLNECVLSNPVVTSSTEDPEESQPNEEAPEPVLNESVVGNPSPCSLNLSVSNSCNATFNTIFLVWVGKWLAGNHSPNLMCVCVWPYSGHEVTLFWWGRSCT